MEITHADMVRMHEMQDQAERILADLDKKIVITVVDDQQEVFIPEDIQTANIAIFTQTIPREDANQDIQRFIDLNVRDIQRILIALDVAGYAVIPHEEIPF